MSQLVINIAYIADNQETVKALVRQLKKTNVHFNLIDANNFAPEEDFYKFLVVEHAPCLLMVSDNFLKSNACLRNGLNYLQALIKKEQVIPIIIDGVSIDSQGNSVKIPTEFEKVSNVIKYMNFWQEKYLDLRKLKRTISEAEEEAFAEQLKIVRSISSEVGEFLRNLRDTNYYSLEDFSANNFEAFFRNFGDEASYSKFVGENSIKEEATAHPLETEETEAAVPDFLPLEQLIIGKEAIEKTDAIVAETVEATAEDKDIVFSEKAPTEAIPNEIEVHDEAAIEKLIAIDPEWAAANEEETVLEETTDSSLTDTELLALELANKLPTTNTSDPEIETYFVEEEEEEEEMISLEDLMGTDFLEETKKEETIENDTQLLEANLEGDPLTEESDAIAKPSMDLFSELKESDGMIIKEKTLTEEEEEEELEGYFTDEGEELEESEEELSELEILERANTLVQAGKITEGISFLEETLIEAPEFISVRYQYAAFLAKYQNNFKEASDQLAILLEQEPNNLPAKFFLGELAEAERDYLTAKSYYEKVYEENVDFPNVAYKLGMLMVNHLKETPLEAANYFKQAYAQNTDNINALYQLGLLQGESLGKKEEAIQSLKTVIEKAPEHPFANYDLAIIYHNEGNRDQALQYYQKAASVNPELKTLVNDQAFAIAQEEMVIADQENTANETSANASLAGQSADLVEVNAEEAIIALDTPQNISVTPENDAFKFSKTEATDTEIASVLAPSTELRIPEKEPTKTALITGATSGIGKATAIKFAEAGYQLILTGRRFSRLFQLKDEFEKAYDTKVRLLPFDIKDADAVQAALTELEEGWQTIDILINNAGLAKGEAAIHEGELDHWDNMIDTNVKGLLYVTREVAPHMVRRQKGQIINVCSLAGKEVYPNNAVYCATKHAVDALTKAMRVDLHKYNIKVSQVSPGFVADTEFSMIKHEQSEPSALGFTPINAQEVAEVIYFMTTQPKHVNLQEIIMTGTQQATANIIERN